MLGGCSVTHCKLNISYFDRCSVTHCSYDYQLVNISKLFPTQQPNMKLRPLCSFTAFLILKGHGS